LVTWPITLPTLALPSAGRTNVPCQRIDNIAGEVGTIGDDSAGASRLEVIVQNQFVSSLEGPGRRRMLEISVENSCASGTISRPKARAQK